MSISLLNCLKFIEVSSSFMILMATSSPVEMFLASFTLKNGEKGELLDAWKDYSMATLNAVHSLVF